MDSVELITIPGIWDFEYRYFAGETASRFFGALKTEGRIFATRCPTCERNLVPARSFCDACFVEATGWFDAGLDGTLDIFTIVATQFPGLPPPPFVIAYVTLDGADTAILNHVTGVDLSDIEAAAQFLMTRPRVQARFSDSREGRITDFHFELVR
jgi:uncharacterized OB-fold protein